jgi:hypothetical protein
MVKRRAATPMIIQFQPQKFAVFSSTQKLKSWEDLLVKNVGLKRRVATALRHAVSENGGTCCESGSTNDCDVD